MSDRLKVSEAAGLLSFMINGLKGWTRNTIKQRLKAGCVEVNGKSVTKHDHALKAGDEVVIRGMTKGLRRGMPLLEVLYSDSDLIAINKPANLLSVATTKEKENHAQAILSSQLSHASRVMKLWPVHRLDRDTSGVLLFATSYKMREAVARLWPQAEKSYLAVVEGIPSPSKGTIDQPLRQDPRLYVMHVGKHPEAKKAVSHYETQRVLKGRALLSLRLETGRQHQIRAHLAWLGYPVVGDQRYGKDGPRMGLHALQLSVTHPVTGERLELEAPVPDDFNALLT